MSETTNNAKIAGEGTIGGGTYGDVSINGAGTVSGDVTCERLKINGMATCKGSVKADVAIVNGTGRFDGQVQIGELGVNGETTMTQSAGIGSLKLKGRMSVNGGLAARTADVRGELVVGENLEAEALEGEGAFRVGGLLNAGRVSFRLHGQSSAREIGGESITVLGPRGFVPAALLGLFSEKRLTVDVVEGDDVTLEYTTAQVVRGATVSIGEGCRIGTVEYTGSLTRLADATVAEERKIPVP